MYIGFNLSLNNTHFLIRQLLLEGSLSIKRDIYTEILDYYDEEKAIYDNVSRDIRGSLKDYIGPDGAIEASKLQDDWFPQVEADIFISHSHRNEKIAIALAGYLRKNFQLNCFIDSCVWGYADDLIEKIDRYYWEPEDGRVYNYKKRNISTSHVHMMLSNALTVMIDKCECLLFLNTPDSVSIKNIMNKPQTFSPWLFHEVAMSHLIQHKDISEYRGGMEKISSALHEAQEIVVKYDIDLSHLIPLHKTDLIRWEEKYKNSPTTYALDVLYKHIFKKMRSHFVL